MTLVLAMMIFVGCNQPSENVGMHIDPPLRIVFVPTDYYGHTVQELYIDQVCNQTYSNAHQATADDLNTVIELCHNPEINPNNDPCSFVSVDRKEYFHYDPSNGFVWNSHWSLAAIPVCMR